MRPTLGITVMKCEMATVPSQVPSGDVRNYVNHCFASLPPGESSFRTIKMSSLDRTLERTSQPEVANPLLVVDIVSWPKLSPSPNT